jgi:hypothetical protein
MTNKKKGSGQTKFGSFQLIVLHFNKEQLKSGLTLRGHIKPKKLLDLNSETLILV